MYWHAKLITDCNVLRLLHPQRRNVAKINKCEMICHRSFISGWYNLSHFRQTCSLSLACLLQVKDENPLCLSLSLFLSPGLWAEVALCLSLSLPGMGTGQRPRANLPTRSYLGSEALALFLSPGLRARGLPLSPARL